jgi:hypothetical protein
MSQHGHTSTESGAVSAVRRSPSWPFVVGVPLLLVALFLQTVTLSSERYLNTLLTALVFTALADACFIFAFRRGGIFARGLSVVCLLPTLSVVSDFLRRVS